MADIKKNYHYRTRRLARNVCEYVVYLTYAPPGIYSRLCRYVAGNKAQDKYTTGFLAPLGAKLFLQALTENLLRYEKNFGEIKIPPRGHSLADQLLEQQTQKTRRKKASLKNLEKNL